MDRRRMLRYMASASVGLQLDRPTLYGESSRDRLDADLAQPAANASNNVPSSPAGIRIHLNRLGYTPQGEKAATVTLPSDIPGGTPFTLVPSAHTSQPVYKGTLSPAVLDPHSGEIAAKAVFSGLRTTGNYRLAVAGTMSDPFPIAPNPYADVLRSTARSFYGQRCGCPVDLGGGFRHASCHPSGGFHPSSGRSGTLPNSGGWHDAGDYGRYVTNSAISAATLMLAAEMFPQTVHRLDLRIPESGHGTPDLLAEVRWCLNWMLAMQDTDGGVWHKQTSPAFCGMVMPENDPLPSLVIGSGSDPWKTTCATGAMAATAAMAARLYKPYDGAFAAQCLAAARRAFTWAGNNPERLFRNPHGVTTGEYGDSHPADSILWAAAELWRATGEAGYQAAFLQTLQRRGLPSRMPVPSWGVVLPMACWSYARGHNPQGEVQSKILEATIVSATALSSQTVHSLWSHTLSLDDYQWGSNGTAANQSLLLLVASGLQGEAAWHRSALSNLDYLFGRNCHGVSWVTGAGERSVMHPHHRPSVADAVVQPWPGLLSGGPNGSGGDPVSEAMTKSAPMRMWRDVAEAYSLNEVAINWNSPLVLLLASANT